MPRIKEQFEAMRSNTQSKIITAGLKLFSYKGLAATSIQDIANLAGTSTGLMYHYYKSKEDLFLELVEIAVNSSNDSARLIFDSDRSPAEKIKIFTRGVIDEIDEGDQIGQFFLLMVHYTLGIDLPKKNPEIQKKGVTPLEWMNQTIMEGQALGEIKPGDPDELAMIYFSTIQGLAIYKLTLGDSFVIPNPDLLNSLLLTRISTGSIET